MRVSARQWRATINVDGHSFDLNVATEEEAAVAFDQMILYYRGRDAARNVPDRRLEPASHEQLRHEVGRRRKAAGSATSLYRGVSYVNLYRRCTAAISSDGRTCRLGLFTSEVEAAIAYDRATPYFRGPGGARNFPELTLTAASPEEIRAERREEVKRTSASRYAGVSPSTAKGGGARR